MQVTINNFVRRQTPNSPFTHFDGTDEELLKMVSNAIDAGTYRQGYREGVILVSVSSSDFHTGVVDLIPGDYLVGRYQSRCKDEAPRKSTYVFSNRQKQQAESVEVVCYGHDVLVETGEAETQAEWEIISLNGYPTEETAPIAPMTLMHNHFESDGGTKTNMSAEEFEKQMRESFEYWKNKFMLAPHEMIETFLEK